jgi:hypothetical protein
MSHRRRRARPRAPEPKGAARQPSLPLVQPKAIARHGWVRAEDVEALRPWYWPPDDLKEGKQ